jgi:hypothetical protein
MPTTTIMLPVNAATINMAHASNDTTDKRPTQFGSPNIATHPHGPSEVNDSRRNRRLRSRNTTMSYVSLLPPAVGPALSSQLQMLYQPDLARHFATNELC